MEARQMYEPEADACSSPLPDRVDSIQKGSISIQGASKEPDYLNLPKPDDYDKWMPCKQQAWDQMKTNPNGFFYRHVLPGEDKKNGPWSEQEKMHFIEVLKLEPEVPAHWGLFARKIPGRVGYQCNAFYKKLILSGELQRLAPEVKIPEIKVKEPSENSKSSKPRKVISNDNTHSYNCSLEEEKPLVIVQNIEPNNSFSKRIKLAANDPKFMSQFMANASIFF